MKVDPVYTDKYRPVGSELLCVHHRQFKGFSDDIAPENFLGYILLLRKHPLPTATHQIPHQNSVEVRLILGTVKFHQKLILLLGGRPLKGVQLDRKSTRLNSSHVA